MTTKAATHEPMAKKKGKRHLRELLEKKSEPRVNVSARIPMSLHDELQAALGAAGISLQDLLTAQIKDFIDEAKG